jgi:hypothetical protein
VPLFVITSTKEEGDNLKHVVKVLMDELRTSLHHAKRSCGLWAIAWMRLLMQQPNSALGTHRPHHFEQTDVISGHSVNATSSSESTTANNQHNGARKHTLPPLHCVLL